MSRALTRSLSASLVLLIALSPSWGTAATKKKKKPAAKPAAEEQVEPAPPLEPSEGDTNAPAASKVEPLAPSAPPPGGAAAKPTDPKGVKKGPFPRIADDEETIYAVQRKAYLVNRKVELTPMISASFGDRFVRTFAPAGSVTYHMAENFGLELFGAYMFPTESSLTKEILDKGKLQPEIAKLTQMLWAAGLGFQWSPIYGKIQMFGTQLGNFNFYLGAGAGLGQTRVYCTPNDRLDPNRGFNPDTCPMIPPDRATSSDADRVVYEPARMQFMGAFSGGVRFYFSNRIGLKIEVKDWVFATRVFRPMLRFTDSVRNNIFAQLGLSFLLGGEE